MSTSKNAKIQIETGQTVHDFAVMTDSGDHKVHTISGGDVWSGKSGYEPDVRPNGMVTGRNVLTAHADDDKVSVAAFTAYSKGVLKSVSGTTTTFTRPATASKAKIYSVTMASDGSLAVVAGTISASTAFSETRDAAGGPPYIPANSVEVGQIRVTSSTSAAVDSDEIFQNPGDHCERYDFPVWEESNLGEGLAANSAAKENAHIEFASALTAIHTAGAYKQVYIKYYEPQLSEMTRAYDFKPAQTSHSANSQEYYRGAVASVSSSLGQGGFTALLSDGITDSIIVEEDEILTVKFFQDENRTPYILTQGVVGLASGFPADNQASVAVTVTAEQKSAFFSS